MSSQNDLLITALVDLEEDEFDRLFKDALAAGQEPLELLESCRKGMEIVGKRFETKEYFLVDLIMAAEIFKNASSQLEPKLIHSGKVDSAGTIVFGTVHGDIHDIGKDIVIAMLRGAGFTVHDLGVDAAPQAFIDKVIETDATVVGMTGLITISFDSMKDTIDALTAAGLRQRVKVMIGGGMVNEKVREHVGADAWGEDVVSAVALAHQLTGQMTEVI
ncbi:B12-binding domain-containing protein [Chloroflexota bacterium]